MLYLPGLFPAANLALQAPGRTADLVTQPSSAPQLLPSFTGMPKGGLCECGLTNPAPRPPHQLDADVLALLHNRDVLAQRRLHLRLALLNVPRTQRLAQNEVVLQNVCGRTEGGTQEQRREDWRRAAHSDGALLSSALRTSSQSACA